MELLENSPPQKRLLPKKILHLKFNLIRSIKLVIISAAGTLGPVSGDCPVNTMVLKGNGRHYLHIGSHTFQNARVECYNRRMQLATFKIDVDYQAMIEYMGMYTDMFIFG